MPPRYVAVVFAIGLGLVGCSEEPIASAEWQGAVSPEALAELKEAIQTELSDANTGFSRIEPADNGRIALFAAGPLDEGGRALLMARMNDATGPKTSEVTLTFLESAPASATDSIAEQALRAAGRPTGTHKALIDWRRTRLVPVSERESGGSLLAARRGPVFCELRLHTDPSLPDTVVHAQAVAGDASSDARRAMLDVVTSTLARMRLIYPHRIVFADPALAALPADAMKISRQSLSVNLGALPDAAPGIGVDVGDVLHNGCNRMLELAYPATATKLADAQRLNGLLDVKPNPRWRASQR